MKKLFAFLMVIAAGTIAHAQNPSIVLYNSACSGLDITIIPTNPGFCTPDNTTSATYQLPGSTTNYLYLDIYSGGPGHVINWTGSGPASSGAEIYSVTVMNTGGGPTTTLYHPCTLGPTVRASFTATCGGNGMFYSYWVPIPGTSDYRVDVDGGGN